ncbi:MAG: FAD-dependent oxidoreductase [Bacteroidetes bacterium]|nr:FAD-dependent oxidoreductase [Bacteroidota bacterium]
MKTDVVVLGAGPAGLTAAHSLLRAGKKVALIEKAPMMGGQMRAVTRGDYYVDFGYKHLYNRIPEVHAFWTELLGADYIKYQPRTGILYQNKILEKEKEYKGLRRGLPYRLLATALADLLRYRLLYRNRPITNMEEYAHARRGKLLTEIFTQGYDERVKGRKWSQLPLPESKDTNPSTANQSGFLRQFLTDASLRRDPQSEWSHPMRGTGQIVDTLERDIRTMGAEIHLQSEAKSLIPTNEKVTGVRVQTPVGEVHYEADHVISSLPIAAIARALDIPLAPAKAELSFRRSVIMVYLFLSRPVGIPYNTIQVSDPDSPMGRLTNYEAYGGAMVPNGKGCLCVEFFCMEDSVLFSQSDEALYDLAYNGCSHAGITAVANCTDWCVYRNKGVDPATSYEDFVTDPSRASVYNQLQSYINLYQIGRTGIDRATHTGLLAAEAIINGDRLAYELRTRPDLFAPWRM